MDYEIFYEFFYGYFSHFTILPFYNFFTSFTTELGSIALASFLKKKFKTPLVVVVVV